MEKVQVNVAPRAVFRATEVIADLRNVAETLFNPLKLIGFWDSQAGGIHLCPQEQSGRECPHNLPEDDPQYQDYTVTANNQMRAKLEVYFPHADLSIYLR